MNAALSRLLRSSKFWTVIIGLVVTSGATLFARYGIDVSTEAVQQTAVTVAALFGILLHAQGQADQGKNAVEAAKTGPNPSSTDPTPTDAPKANVLPLVGVVLSVALIAFAIAGCKLLGGSATRVAADTIDCLKPNTKSVAGELQGVMGDLIRNSIDNTGSLDFGSVKAAASSFKTDAPRCAFMSALTEAIRLATGPRDPNAPQTAELQVDPVQLAAVREQVRVELFDGKNFRLAE